MCVYVCVCICMCICMCVYIYKVLEFNKEGENMFVNDLILIT